MLKIENTEVYGWEAAIRGMRNPKNSWSKFDSWYGCHYGDYGHTKADRCNMRCKGDCGYCIGENDHGLMMRLAKAGTEHAKYLRYINVTVDTVAPLYWYKEMDCYRFGVEHNSCSTMHTIHKKPFSVDDFSVEQVVNDESVQWGDVVPYRLIEHTVDVLNECRNKYMETKDKKWWYSMIQLLPSSYNQRRTYQFSYQALANIYRQRRNHKLDEWHTFCDWIESLPYSELITGGE